MTKNAITAISFAVYESIKTRELHKSQLLELRRIAVAQCGFDQEVVAKCNVVDLLDGYVKGVLAVQGDQP